jgi:NitT/TauT family transport system substrate-binding protein
MKKHLISAIVGGTALALLAGCSTAPGTSTGQNGPAELKKITVGVVPVADVAPLYLGIQKGFFEAEGLEVTVKNVQGAAAAVPLLLNGEMQFSYGAFQPVIAAAAANVPVVYAAGGIVRAASADEDFSAIIVKPDSPIKTIKDLEGHSLAINALRGGPDLVSRLAVEAEGADIDKVKLVEVPLPETIATLERGNVDAAYVAEPFRVQALKAGYRSIGAPSYLGSPEGSTSGYFTVKPFVERDRATVDAFARAMHKSAEYAQANLDEVRAEIVKYTKLDAAVVAEMNLPPFSAELTVSSLEKIIGQIKTVGWIKTTPDAKSMVLE